MKKYYLKQKVFALADRYKVYDEQQNLAFHCEGQLLSLSHRMDFFASASKQLLFTIKRQVFSFMPVYHLTAPDGREVATVRQRITFLKKKLDIESVYGHFEIEGDFLAHSFRINAGASQMVEFTKKWLAWGDSYEITILADQNVEFFVALVVMIDDCMHDNDNHR